MNFLIRFCANCPAVVINSAEVNKMLGHRLPHWDVGSEFAVLGIVNLDAVVAYGVSPIAYRSARYATGD